MKHVVVIGCGVIGAAIAYELSRVPGLKITVLDQQPPAQGATAAALGVLMGVISHKTKGRAWQMRQASIQRYETLIPELEAISQRQIPCNRQGILMLLVPRRESGNVEEDLANWQKLVENRASDGWQLEIWDTAQVKSRCPQVNSEQIKAAVYSPQDRQVDPVSLTLALVDAAKSNGVTFHFGVTVEEYYLSTTTTNQSQCRQIKTKSVGAVNNSPLLQDVDWLVVCAGLGSFQSLQGIQGWATLPHKSNPNLSATELRQLVDIRPVLGQAIHLQLTCPLGNPNFQPVITGNDVHIVPYSGGVSSTEYWVGATVEFPSDSKDIVPDSALLDAVMQQAIAFCPDLAEATVLKTWSGLRPRPENRPAPVIGHLPGFSNVLLATGHYRNGVLLAPATAEVIRQMILDNEPQMHADAHR